MRRLLSAGIGVLLCCVLAAAAVTRKVAPEVIASDPGQAEVVE